MAGNEDVGVVLGDGQHLRGDVLGEAVGELRRVGEQHLGDAGDLRGGRGGDRAGVRAGHQHVDVAAALACAAVMVFSVAPLSDALSCSAMTRVVMSCLPQITLASFFSLSTSVATSGTFTPAPRLGGSTTFSVFRRGVTSTPRSSGLNVSSGFFFAFMMLGSVT